MSLLREARRQRPISTGKVPEICVLYPDGDIVCNLLEQNNFSLNLHWACYHSKLYNFELAGITFGIVGCAVGSSYALEIISITVQKWLSTRAAKPENGTLYLDP